MLFIGNPANLFFLIDFSRVGGKTLQMRKKEKKYASLAGGFCREEPQPCFGLRLRAEKSSGVLNLFGCKDAAFPPRVPASAPSPTVAVPGGQQPPSFTSPILLCLLQPTQVRRGVCRGGALILLRRARAGQFMFPLSAFLWPCPPSPGGQQPPGDHLSPHSSAPSSSPSPGAHSHSPSTCESGSPLSPHRIQEGSSPQVPTSHVPSGPSPWSFILPWLWGASALYLHVRAGIAAPPSRSPRPPALGSAHRAQGARPGAPGRPSPGPAPLPPPPPVAPAAPRPPLAASSSPPPPSAGGGGRGERGGVANGRSAYSGLSPARPPIAAGGGGNIVEWSLDAAAAAGWNGAAAGAARVFREGGVRRRRRPRVEAAEGERERKEGRGRGVLSGGGGTGRAPHLSVAAAGGPGGGAAPRPQTPQSSRPPTRWPRAAAEATGAGAVGWGGGGGDRHGVPQTP